MPKKCLGSRENRKIVVFLNILLINMTFADTQFDADYETRYPRTYQWSDSRTGTPYLSGRMPYWYEGKILHPNPPCTIVWQRGTIIDNTCEKNDQIVQQYRKNTKDYLDGRDAAIQKAKRLNKLKEAGELEFGLTEKDVIYILGEPSKITITKNTTTFRYDNLYSNIYIYVEFKDGEVIKFDKP